MNIIKATASEVLASIGKVAAIVPQRSTLPALQNIFMSKAGETIKFIGSDIDVQIESTANLGGDEGRASTTVAASRLLPLLKSLPADQTVTLSMDGAKLTLKAGRSKFNLQTLPPEGFPMFRESAASANVTMTQAALSSLIDHTHFANDGRHQQSHFNGTLLDFRESEIVAVASDGLRMAKFSVERAGDATTAQTILPRKSMLELRKLLDDSDEPVSITLSPTHARFDFESVVFMTKIIGAKYPDYQRVMGLASKEHRVSVSRVALLGLMRRCQVIMADIAKSPGVHFKFSQGLLEITARAVGEDGEQSLEIDYSGPELTIGLPISQVIDGLSNFNHEVVTLAFSRDKPLIMSYEATPSFSYLIALMTI